MEQEKLINPEPKENEYNYNSQKNTFTFDSNRRAYDNLKFYPINVLDAVIVAFLGISLILAVLYDQATLSATVVGVFGGYISKSAVNSLSGRTNSSDHQPPPK